VSPLFPDRATQDRFFSELRELIDRYPSIGGRMAATAADDPGADWALPVPGYHSGFDPSAPMLLEGIVLVVSHRNIDGFEDLSVIRQRESSHYHDLGLLTAAIETIT